MTDTHKHINVCVSVCNVCTLLTVSHSMRVEKNLQPYPEWLTYIYIYFMWDTIEQLDLDYNHYLQMDYM